MSQPTITVKNARIVYRTLKNGKGRNALSALRPGRMETFEAVHPLSFETREGEIVGLVGRNGSGKSTLLRALSGIFAPDSGSIETYGNTVSLMALGVGFRNDLTGRENIFLSGLLLGFREHQIREKLEDIIAFSELGEFIDRPVRTYSSGMFSKLAFSISAVMEPDILLIDEVLSVGDAKFKKKSAARIRTLLQDRVKTAMIVSHNMDTLRSLCTRVLWIDGGTLTADGPTEEVIAAYEADAAE